MSTFSGEIKEIPFVSIDYFENCKQKCYFLSHCHSDHMKGLAQLESTASIYASSISALFVRRKFPHLQENIKILDVGITLSIELPADERGSSTSFTVTALPAGHCAGSIMILLQTDLHDILYTGDFRISVENARNIKLLEELRSRKNFVVYLDSTFMNSFYTNFPKQSDSVREIVDIVRAFLSRSKNHKVHLEVPARYGYEYLLMELGKKLCERVWVCDSSYDEYLSISRLSSCVSNDHDGSRIHLILKYNKKHESVNKKDVLKLQLSAMYWRNWSKGRPFARETDRNTYRICYATHSSFNEIRDLLHYLEPKKVYLNVVPENLEAKMKMFNDLSEIQSKYVCVPVESEAPKKFSFGHLRKKSRTIE